MAKHNIFLSIVRVSLVLGLVKSQCHPNWDYFGDSCYLFSDDTLTWLEAEESCRAHNANLAEVESLSEANFLRFKARRYGAYSYYLGARDHAIEGMWEWSHSGKDLTTNDWAPGQPDDHGSGQDCLRMWSKRDYQWDDCTCIYSLNYVCEIG